MLLPVATLALHLVLWHNSNHGVPHVRLGRHSAPFCDLALHAPAGPRFCRWLDFGSLLGIHRDGELIKHDNDVRPRKGVWSPCHTLQTRQHNWKAGYALPAAPMHRGNLPAVPINNGRCLTH